MTELIGILNLTPDSFSDGGQAGDAPQAMRQFVQLLEDGAHRVDVGAESTRPGATPLTHLQEWARLQPFFEQVKQAHPELLPRLSIDTRHAQTARKALTYKVGWINDVGGFAAPDMVAAVKDASCDIVAMHSLGVPADPKVTLPQDSDPVSLLKDWAIERIKALGRQGIALRRIILDPGIGFGKTAQQSAAIIERAMELRLPGVRLLVGHSRKSFLSLYTNAEARDRDGETALLSARLAKAGVDYLRVHNIRENTKAIDAVKS